MKVASIQMSVVEGNKEATLQKAADSIEKCTDADLVILPEIWNIGFMSFDGYVKHAEAIDGPTPSLMKKLAAKMNIYLHTGSFVEEDNGQYYNTSLLVSPEGEVVGRYRKIHLFGYNSQETQILSPGQDVVVVDTPFGKIGMATCFDLRFPELFRAMVDKGAELFMVCSAWPYPRIESWIMLNRVRALENQAYLISANSAGLNGGSQFVGHSMVVDPWGTILAGAGDEEMIVKTTIDLKKTTHARKRFPGLAGRKDFLSRSSN
ncbi:MAG: carbon-nitrogen family hydrolase [Proteobacteria bacterium]|nr:carbon-nitrogen family hydrolase [Pseudomonadota bacterium]MBU1584225.1 carbon-nitrogen family hydrolase [Pseudomonadota bacterium]MBU2451703.1 carbon-nitrogen family hydrolase [Pseudomonadota bacterium]MBU2628947.1 carbon-nitrogen family hydrolase [Pseudomonadota bacterium]